MTPAVDLADSLDLKVVAEGIETPDQLAWLRRLGVEIGQGFLFGRPAPASDAVRAAGVDLRPGGR